MALKEEGLRSLIDELMSEWEESSQVSDLSQPKARRNKRLTGNDVARMAAVYGFSTHVYETSKSIRLLLDAGHSNSAIPLIRLVYEISLTAMWVANSEDQHGVLALLHENARNRGALKRDALDGASATFRDGVHELADADTSLYTDTADSVRYFNQVCLDLDPGGMDAYIYFRAFSSSCHASVPIIDLYFDESPKDELTLNYRATPKEGFPESTLLFFTSAAMIWGARAFTYFTNDRSYRDFLRRKARLLEIKADLDMSAHYRDRHAKASASK